MRGINSACYCMNMSSHINFLDFNGLPTSISIVFPQTSITINDKYTVNGDLTNTYASSQRFLTEIFKSHRKYKK